MSSKLHPAAQTGEFLPKSRSALAIDAMVEYEQLSKLFLKNFIPEDTLNDDHHFAMRGLVMRLHSLADIIYATACGDDDLVRNSLKSAYGSQHEFKQTETEEAVR